MAKTFAGARLRRLREEQGLTQVALARALDLSTSYVNQLENDQRPITVPVLLALTERFALPAHYFAPDSDARLIADLREILAESPATSSQIDELVARMPDVGKAMVSLHRRFRDVTAELEVLRGRASDDPVSSAQEPMPFEEVRDFFYDRKNYVPELDVAAEQMFVDHGLRIGGLDAQLTDLLAAEYGVTVHLDDGNVLAANVKRRYFPDVNALYVARWLQPGQRAFQLATQLALLTQDRLIDSLMAADEQLSPDARAVARIGLANYFAGRIVVALPQVSGRGGISALRHRSVGPAVRGGLRNHLPPAVDTATPRSPGNSVHLRAGRLGRQHLQASVRHCISLLPHRGQLSAVGGAPRLRATGGVSHPGCSDARRAVLLLDRPHHHLDTQ
jgi:transcriptional regulator with XRE-family HTH domain